MLKDAKFRFLLFACFLVIAFEALSLAGINLPPRLAIPLFSAIIIGIGYQTLYKGIIALATLQFKKIELLMLIAVTGAFYLGRYEEAAVVIVLYTLAEKLEDMGIAKSRSAFDILLKQIPQEVQLVGQTKSTPLASVKIGDVIALKPGVMIPLDGEVVKGASSVDESTITGEPIPKDKLEGDIVFAGTFNIQGYLEIRVNNISADSKLAKIKQMTFEASQAKAKTQTFIETFAQYYTPSIILIAFLVVFIPTIIEKENFNYWFLESLSLLVIACPCALVVSTPISIYSAIGNASANGALIKGGRYLEALSQIKAIALDKTRTLTIGRPYVTDVIPFGSNSHEHFLSCAAGIEAYSEHPLSQGIMEAAKANNYIPHSITSFKSIAGKGAKADCLVCGEKHHCIGKLEFILEEHKVPQEVINEIEKLENTGKTVIVVSTHEQVEGILAFADTIHHESKALIAELHQLGIATIMLTGDHTASAKKVAEELGIQDVRANLLPEEKAFEVQKLLKQYTSAAMVGDGVNDAPALALSTVGITLTSLGSDTAIEASSIVILNDRLLTIPKLIRLARRTTSIIKFNLFWAILVKLIFVTLAVMGLSNLVLAIFADVGVTIFVILNALRLTK